MIVFSRCMEAKQRKRETKAEFAENKGKVRKVQSRNGQGTKGI